MHQGAGRSKKRSPPHILADEHLSEACAAPYPIKSDANPALAGQSATHSGGPLGLRWGFETTSNTFLGPPDVFF